MTEQELQIAVCKALGWKLESYKEEESGADIPIWKNPQGMYVRHNPPPLTLDLMHEAEKTLTDDEHDTFRCNLFTIIESDRKGEFVLIGPREYVSSTAIQHATAFIAVKQKGI